MNSSGPTAVPGAAAADARAFVFQHRNATAIDPLAVAAHLTRLGYGRDIPPDIRGKRLKKWALQVHRRLLKYGWLEEPGPGGWPPTAALRECREPEALARRVPRTSQREARSPTPPPPPPDFWRDFVQVWIFQHRQSAFRVGEIAAAMVQRGYEGERIHERLDAAREVADKVLYALDHEGLLTLDPDSEMWTPTDVLRTWPSAK